LLIFLVRNGSSYLAAYIIEMPFANVENTHKLLFEYFELPEFIKPLLASCMIGPLEL